MDAKERESRTALKQTTGLIDGVFTNKPHHTPLQLARNKPPWRPTSVEFTGPKQTWMPDTVSGMCYLLSVVPAIVLTYLQLILNILMVVIILSSTLQFSRILSADLDKHINIQENLILASVVECTREYLRNRCASGDLPPALEKGCDAWRLCMERDTRNIMKSKETAVVLANILNNFFDSLSDRTIFCTGGLLVGSVLLANMTLTWSRRKLATTI